MVGASAAGERLLVHGAAGGVGLTAVEIGKRMGAMSRPPQGEMTSSLSPAMAPMR
ncbi:MAG: hypothetical protein R3D03_08170 [Geminicoccaceae bacterium]